MLPITDISLKPALQARGSFCIKILLCNNNHELIIRDEGFNLSIEWKKTINEYICCTLHALLFF